MSRISPLAILTVMLMALVFCGCTIQPLQAPETRAGADGAIDYALNPELRFMIPSSNENSSSERFSADVNDMPAIFFATKANYVAGEWICEQADGQQVIRMDQDGRISRVVGPDDAIDIGYFWFSDGDFHVISDVDRATDESVFHVFVETDDEGTRLRFELCGGNCPNAGNIDWLHGLSRVTVQG